MSNKGKYQLDPKETRVYAKENSCIFKKNKDEFGGLSNMATGFPLSINGIEIKTTEALYQACRFSHLPEIQKKIIDQKSPMNVKMISNANQKQSRGDWDNIRLKVMKWCINVKLAQNFINFGTVIHETGLKNIVENSSKDNYWGAIPNGDATVFTGKNALGRLLMDLRQTFYGKDCYSLLYVIPPKIDNFFLYNEAIGILDERKSFIYLLQSYWATSERDAYRIEFQSNSIVEEQNSNIFPSKEIQSMVDEDVDQNVSLNKKKGTRKQKDKAPEPSLFDNNI